MNGLVRRVGCKKMGVSCIAGMTSPDATKKAGKSSESEKKLIGVKSGYS